MPKVIVQIDASPGEATDPGAVHTSVPGLRDIARALDGLGYWGLSHAGSPPPTGEVTGPSPDPGLWNVYLGQATRRLRHGQFGYALPTGDPAGLAGHVALMDHMLEGRLFVGVARDGAGAGDPRHRALFGEHFRLMKQAWKAGGAGRRCWQDPHPPVFQPLAHGRAGLQWAARQGVVPVTPSAPAEVSRWFAQLYRHEAMVAGRDVVLGEGTGVLRSFSIHRSRAEAAAAVERWHLPAWRGWPLGGRGRPTAEELGEAGLLVAGTLDEVRRRLAAQLREVPVEYLVWPLPYPAMPKDVVLEQVELLATRVMPDLGMEAPVAPTAAVAR
jgi:alkanesulfonate monooxygenase SsuD/methylene tetrahydromethanopterin reductase-like flavin-dependent oxidoreductase (luciferase family)